ncbi:hypothetical protein [Streptomyces sp. ISL-100]|uniref:hypothetical protein n=1 Tax=Streptomyces sp. ISL-100 TaxID=2819173 RepID=UPI0020361E39|nr:hypothetical protein [Streptomyces sp. ISL-100]
MFPGVDAARVLDQVGQQVELQVRQRDPLSVHLHRVGPQIDEQHTLVAADVPDKAGPGVRMPRGGRREDHPHFWPLLENGDRGEIRTPDDPLTRRQRGELHSLFCSQLFVASLVRHTWSKDRPGLAW